MLFSLMTPFTLFLALSMGISSKAVEPLEKENIRLIGGRTPAEGRVEIYFNGSWGTVCDDSWDDSDALVVCRMLGYSDGIAYRKAKFGEGSGPIWLDEVQCDETEYNIEDCLQNAYGDHNCDHSSDAGVLCNHSLGAASAAYWALSVNPTCLRAAFKGIH
uniref:SRCR domain-containing protein n=1 Tax=Octopus bimaculoides TaxID=37653 RepID=A0A0L8HXJ7_OCTBM